MIHYLSQHKLTAWLIFIAYFLGLVYFHETATDIADWLKYQLTLRVYNVMLLISGLSLSLMTAYYLWRRVVKHPERRIFLLGFLATILLMTLALFTLMVVNMEAIHYVQYGILAVLLFPLVKRYEDAFVGTVVLGLVDEVYQYLVLNPDFKYFDFNDIILNMLGAGAGLLAMAALVSPSTLHPRRWYRSSAFIFSCIVLIMGSVFSCSGVVSFFPGENAQHGPYWFSLYRKELPESFWTYLYHNRYYHILRPWEGIILMMLLTGFYALIDIFNNRSLSGKRTLSAKPTDYL